MATSYKKPTFDFGRAISQLFSQPGGRDFAIRLILWTSVLLGITFAIIAKPYLSMMGDMLEGSWVSSQNPEDPEAALAIFTGLTKYILPMLLATLLMWAVYASAEAALHKRIFHNHDAGFFPLRFGADEIRVMGAQFVVYLMVFGIYILGVILIALVAGIIGMAGQGSGAAAALLGLIMLVGFVFFLWFLAYFSIRMAPAAALSVKNDKLAVTDGWRITKKRTGNLFLAYLLIFIVGYVAISVVQMAAFSMILNENYFELMYGLGSENPRVVFEQAAEKLKQPGTIVLLIVGMIVYMIVTVIWWLTIAGVANYAVQWWEETSVENAFD